MNKATVLALFKNDHRRLDRLFENFQDLKLSDYAGALKQFVAFEDGMKKHFDLEEHLLFRFLRVKLYPEIPEVIAVLCKEHRRIEERIRALREKVRAGNLETGPEERRLFSILVQHDLKEEGQVYPLLDQILSVREKESVFDSLAA